MNPLLSIVIPTKNRYTTLIPVLNILSGFDCSNLEIIVQDNSSNNKEIKNYLSIKNDFRIKYNYLATPISVIENSDLAVQNSSGQYVCFIGDDDFVMPYIISVVEWMKLNNYEVLKFSKPIYYWPGQKSNYLSKDSSGVLNYSKWNYKIKIMSSKKGLIHTLNTGGTSMQKLPCLYHGIVKRSVLDKIYKKCNTYFPGPSPDMANAIALSSVINEFIYADFPVIISGNSPKSTGGLGVLHKHVSKIDDLMHLPKSTSKEWSAKIPKYWTGPTIWAESVLKSLQNCGMEKDKLNFNYAYLHAYIYLFNFSDRKIIFKNFKINYFNFSFFISLITLFTKRVNIFIINRLKSLSNKDISNITSIENAIIVLKKNINTSKLPF